jgi:ribosomal protein RSM22 (predicted rRNA methylase)
MPPALAAIIREFAVGHGDLAGRSDRISEHYRRAGSSQGVVGSSSDAVAYALSRMPATYAAVSRVLGEVIERAPGFEPRTLLDAACGPGTAAWAADGSFDGLAKTLFDHNQQFIELARWIGDETKSAAEIERNDLTRFDLGRRFDLVTCAYALTELADLQVEAVGERLWAHADGVLVIVEPGRPRDYQRLMAVRARLVALGGVVLAPCPHDHACPLVEPDWCHFSVRLSRSRDHMRMKGGTLGYEDEKFSYLVVARPGIGSRTPARVIKPAEENKFSVSLPLCTQAGTEVRVVGSRDKVAFKAARNLGWGDSANP